MKYGYTPRQMPARFLSGAPVVVRDQVLDLFAVIPAAPLDFDLILRPDPRVEEITGLDFGRDGAQGPHFFLTPTEWVGYRDRNRRKRVAWADLPEATRAAIVAYLES